MKKDSEDEGTRGVNAPRQLSGRGLAYWSDGKEERILYVTPGYRLIALDAKTGNPVAAFGRGGAVDLKADLDPYLKVTADRPDGFDFVDFQARKGSVARSGAVLDIRFNGTD